MKEFVAVGAFITLLLTFCFSATYFLVNVIVQFEVTMPRPAW